ncbi:hypothetical protein Tco_1492251 [Tanacetum coccineum]
MVSTMTTRNAGRGTTATQGGGQVNRMVEGERSGDQVGSGRNGQGSGRALGWHLEEIHVTLAHLEKKRTRLRTYTKSLEGLCIQRVETASQA